MAEKKKKSHVFGSFRHSTNLSAAASAPTMKVSYKEGNALVELEVLVLDTSLVDLDALDGDDALLWRQEPCRCR